MRFDLLQKKTHLALGIIGGPPSQIKPVRPWSYLYFMGNNLAVAVAAGRLCIGLTCLKHMAAALLIGECAAGGHEHIQSARGLKISVDGYS